MSPDSHRIRRQVLEIRLPSEAADRRLRVELARIQRQGLVPGIERCFDALGLDGQVHRLDRLEVDLGTVDPRHLGRDLVAALEERLPAAVRKALGSTFTPSLSFSDSRQGEALGGSRTFAPEPADRSVADRGAELPSSPSPTSPDSGARDGSVRPRSSVDSSSGEEAASSRVSDDSGAGDGLLPHRSVSGRGLEPPSGEGTAGPDFKSLVELSASPSAPLSGADADLGGSNSFGHIYGHSFGHSFGRPSPTDSDGSEGLASSGVSELRLPRLSPDPTDPSADLATWLRDPRSRLELLDHFLTTGRVPWWANTSDSRLVRLAFDRLISDDSPALVPWLLRTFEHPDARQRWLIALDEPRLGRMLDAVAPPVLRQEVEKRIRALPRSARRPDDRPVAARSTTSSEPTSPARRALWRAAFHTVLALYPGGSGRSPSRPPGAQDLAEPAWLEIFERAVEMALPESPSCEPASRDSASSDSASFEVGPDPRQPMPEDRRRPGPSSDSGTLHRAALATTEADAPRLVADPAGETLYSTHAGVVLLWPFLESFFDHLGLLREGAFLRAEDRHRATGLLHFLATGEREPAEYQLSLAKLLCGLGPGAVFDFGPPVTDAEAEEGEGLLRAVIEQTPISDSMSIDGFRGSFLHRLGALEPSKGLPLLRVERQSWDGVLESFPWSWTWVRLPFMSTILRVEW